MDIGNKIKKIRYHYNLTQGELANILEVNRNYISRLETNKSLPTSDILIKLALSFEISIDNFLDINNNGDCNIKSDRINVINQYCLSLSNSELDFIINVLSVMVNK